MSLIISLTVLVACTSGPLKVHDAYVWPAQGQGTEQTARDKAQCYRVSQGFTDGVLPTATQDTGAAFAIGGLTGGAVAYEQELARRHPPDLTKYGACLSARGYSVDWPSGRQP